MNDSPPHILLVENDRIFSYAIQRSLLSAGYEVIVVGSAEEAMEALAVNAYDLFISAYILPQKNGGQLLRAIRESKDYPTLPFIFQSSLSREDILSRTARYEPNAIVEKPFDFQNLAKMVDRCIRGAPD